MNKKLLLSLGSIAAVSPIVAVVACGSIKEPSSQELDAYRKLTSTEAQRVLEEQWAQKVVTSGNTDFFKSQTLDDKSGQYKLSVSHTAADENKDRLRDVAQFIIKEELAKDANFLFSFGSSLQGSRIKWDNAANVNVDKELGVKELNLLGFKRFDSNGWDATNHKYINGLAFTNDNTVVEGKVSNEAIDLMLNYSKSDFRLKVYKQLVSEDYLLNTSKDEFQKAFVAQGKGLTLIQQDIEDEHYVLVNAALSQKLFATWSISLDATKSAGLVGNTVADLAAFKAQFNPATANSAAAQVKESEKRNVINTAVEKLAVTGNEAMVGWKGFASQSAVGTKALAFTRDSLRKIDALTKWNGAIHYDSNGTADDLTTTNIALSKNNSSTVDINYVEGIMPIYADVNGTKKFTFAGTNLDTKLVARLLAYKDSTIYATATDFYRTKFEGHDAILIKFPTQKVDDIYKNAGFKFRNQRDTE